MNSIGDVAGAKRLDLLGSRGAATDIHPAYGALLAKNRSAACNRVEVRNVAYANPRNIGQALQINMVASDCGDRTSLLDFVKGPVLSAQEFFQLTGRALKNTVRRPHYGDDIILQMDTIGVGSLPIVVIIGFFSGAV